jgi:hypothetical protein
MFDVGWLRAVWLVGAVLVGLDRPIDRDVTPLDVERALAIARSRDAERAAFHAPYIRRLDLPFVETAELVTEYRRVVLWAEERVRMGDRLLAYSVSHAQQAAGPWRHRVAMVARLRFHPQNTYVGLPEIDIELPARPRSRVGVLKEPIFGFASPRPSDRLPVLGARAEGVFDVTALDDTRYEFVIRVDTKEVGRVTFDLAAVE